MWFIWKFCFFALLLGVLTEAYEHPKGFKKSTRNVTSTIPGVDPTLIWDINGEDIYFSSLTATIENAMQICNDMGMALVTIDSVEKNEALKLFIDEYEIENGITYYTSGRRINEEYQWTSGAAKLFSFNDFSNGDDRPDLDDCCISLNVIYNWLRDDCTSVERFICQFI